MMVGSILYEETINMKKQPIQNTNVPDINEKEDKIEKNDEEVKKDEFVFIKAVEGNKLIVKEIK